MKEHENTELDEVPLQALLDQLGPIPSYPNLDTANGRAYQKLFEDLQGNIIKGHDRDYASHIFIKFACTSSDSKENLKDDDLTRKLIKERISKSVFHLTSAARQFRETDLYRRNKIRGKVFVNFFLTYSGYKALGMLEKEVAFDSSFKTQMKGSRARLNDPPKPDANEWQGFEDYRKYKENPSCIDAMILIADDDEEYLKRTELRIVNSVLLARRDDHFDCLGGPVSKDIALASVITVQRGAQLRASSRIFPQLNEPFIGHPIEHFGYLDGISNPLFLDTDQKRVDDFKGAAHWEPWAPLSLALTKDPHPLAGPYATGSYMVFRKLEQNVHLFQTLKSILANRLGVAVSPDPSDPNRLIDKIDRTGALIFGRYKEGTPTSQTPPLLDAAGQYSPDRHHYDVNITNNFNYENPIDDSKGTSCPFHAHIRLANDRTDNTKGHRIIRRGITYGARAEDLSDAPSSGVGLLFICFQKSIRNQFEYIQRKANGMDPDPNSDDTALLKNAFVDPIIGQTNADDLPQGQEWPNQIGINGKPSNFRFTNVVSLKGGEYLFAPSISFLRNIVGQGAKKDDPLAKTFAEKGL